LDGLPLSWVQFLYYCICLPLSSLPVTVNDRNNDMEHDPQISKSAEPLHWQSRVDRIKEYVSANLGNDLRMATVCRELQMNKYTLQHIFTPRQKETFHQYVERLRMEKALQLLAEGKWIKEVINAIGYNNRVTFNKAFKKRFHHTANYYKNYPK
jgi:AraC-like DNA-binding protein